MIKAKLMQELSLLPSDIDEMTYAELSLYGVVHDVKERKNMYSLYDAIALQKVLSELTSNEKVEYLERKYNLWQ